MGWTLKVRDKFQAAHFLREYKGKCEKVHGHTFHVEVAIEAAELDRTGIAIDFTEIKKALAEILPDHTHPQRGLRLQSVGREPLPPLLRRAQEALPGHGRDRLGIRGCFRDLH